MIQTTPDHPFYVKNRGFVNAVELQVGDELLDLAGNVLIVEDTLLEVCVPTVTVYNFEVEDFHTYHVGVLGVLVHNANDYSGIRAEIIKKNRINGKAFEEEAFSQLKYNNPTAETQVSVKPMDAHGNPMTSGGNRLDGLALDSNGNPFIVEYKASETAPYTFNQKSNGFGTGKLNRDVVVVGDGKGIFKPGDRIPSGTNIITIRPK